MRKCYIQCYKAVKEANQKCEQINKRLEHLQEQIEDCLDVIKHPVRTEQLEAFKENLKKIREMSNKFLNKKNMKKALTSPGKDVEDIEQEVWLAEMNFGTFLHVNNFKTTIDIFNLLKRSHTLTKRIAKEVKKPKEEHYKSLKDATEEIKSQLAEIQKTMDEQTLRHKTSEQKLIKDLEKEYEQLQESFYKLAKKLHKQVEQSKMLHQQIDQQTKMMETIGKQTGELHQAKMMIDQHEEKIKHLDQQMEKVMQIKDEKPSENYAVAKCSDSSHKIVTILQGFKRGPKIIRNAVNAVSVFFKFGFAGLRLFTEERSSKERMKHLEENSKRQNMSKSYAEKHRFHIQLVANESSDSSN